MSMSTTDTAPAAPGDRRSGPSAELCRLTVLSAHSQVDLAVPLRIPLTLVIPGIVDTIRSHSGSNDFDTVSEQFEPTDWTLAKVGRAPLSGTLSLHEHGIRDGELLVLEAADAAAPPPLFDDIMYTVAATDAQTYRRWTPLAARITGSVIAVLASLLGSAALIVGATGIPGATCAFITSLLLTIASIVTARVYHDSGTALALGCAGVPLAFTAGLLAVPDELQAPHLLMGSVLVASVALLCLRLCGVGLATFTALFGISLAATAATAAATLLPRVSLETISAVAIALALITLAYSARLSMILAKLPLPPVPVPANPLDEARDLVAEPDMPNFDELTERTGRARSYLTGLVVATSVTAMTGALSVAAVHTGDGVVWSGLALAGVTAGVLMLRGRTFAGTAQAVPLIASGAAIVLVVLGAQIWSHQDDAVVIFALAMALLILALVLGILAPNRVFSPVMRRIAELIDLAAIALIVPLICWVTDLFSVMRGL
ncbi:type VII secretion integral membrane protein EccD [Rhodococcus sp. 24CO]|uniref:type VII secretion integral membrane protein EccD n=1 Tax=Rhodococcus sp. 24CO TaxID=3117460 RepID=UPI003D348818